MSELRASVAAAREAFIEDLHARGFRAADERTLYGDIVVNGEAIEHQISLPDDFPITKPRVRATYGDGGLSWHREHDGTFCLWSDDDAAHLPWMDAEAVVERVAEWHRQDALGWPDDPPDLDLERYWERSSDLILHGDLDDFVGRTCKVKRSGNGTYVLEHGSAPKKQKRIRSWGAVVVDLGELQQPLRTMDDILALLDADSAKTLRQRIETRACKVVIARYSRQGQVGSMGLIVKDLDPLTIVAATTAHTGDATLRLRAGFDAVTLSAKRVAIVGVGAVGSLVADLLARSGCGYLTLVDPDVVRPGNCIRHLAGRRDVGRAKVDAVADHLIADGMDKAAIVRSTIRATSVDFIAELFDEHDLVVDATANGPATALVLTASKVLRRPAVSVCLQRGGTVARVDRSPLEAGEEFAAPTPLGGPSAQGREGGCGEPVSLAPPWACSLAASTAVAVVVDVLTERRQYPPSVVQVLVAHDSLAKVGPFDDM